MSSKGFRGVPGVPDGWELVGVGQPVYNVDHIVGPDGNPKLCDFDSSYLNRVIIRKIEQPAKYRPFANAEEFKPHRDRWWKVKGADTVYPPGHYKDVGYDGSTWQQAFDEFVFDDGTPFGVKIDE
jgi:hypothetical protein